MSTSIFDNKSVKPDNKSLSEVLATTGPLWEAIKKHLKDEYGDLNEEWKFYNQKSGWILKVLRKKRNLFFFTPFEGYFRIVFVFGDKAVAVVEKSDLPQNIIESLKNARKYMEGRGIPLEVKRPEDVENIKKLVHIKIHY
ncbi:MAG: DUF3788 family protein [bacterium]